MHPRTDALEGQNGKLIAQAELIGELQSSSATKNVDTLAKHTANAITKKHEDHDEKRAR